MIIPTIAVGLIDDRRGHTSALNNNITLVVKPTVGNAAQ
jgi:hypothetical protein